MTRTESDLLGSMELPHDCPWGIHTERARRNFPRLTHPVHPALVRAYLVVKHACCQANAELGYLSPSRAKAIEATLVALQQDFDRSLFPLDALQGGAGTSLNMNVNEVTALRATARLESLRNGNEKDVDTEHVNLHQSTNDTFPTALKIAAILGVREAGKALAALQGAFQRRERGFADIPSLGRTELMPAVPMPLGVQFGAMAEAAGRDRWRTAKCEERLRSVNLGGTAVGTGIAAPRRYIFLAIEKLRHLTGLGLGRAENMPGETANADSFVEVSGILKAAAVNLLKAANDLRRLHALGEIALPPVQTGSSLMPGKVNPVICEWTISAALTIKAHDGIIADCAALGSHQIVEFLPLLADSLLAELDLLAGVAERLAGHVDGIVADAAVCRAHVAASEAAATALVPILGYSGATAFVKRYRERSERALSFVEFAESELGQAVVANALKPQTLHALGFDDANNT